MNKQEELEDIVKELTDNRNKLSALFSLYNSSLLSAEETRSQISQYYDQMIDLKNDLSNLTNQLARVNKAERQAELIKTQPKLKTMSKQILKAREEFNENRAKYRRALEDCGSLKTEYKHNLSELCKQFKSEIKDVDMVDSALVRGYSQQVKVIKNIFSKIEALVSDYNVKRNKIDQDSEQFAQLYQNVQDILSRLQVAQ